MAQHRNPSITQDIHRILNVKGGDVVSDQVADTIQPVIPIVRYTDITNHANNTTSGSATLLTTPSDKDFYLCGCQLSMIKDAACDMATGKIIITGQVAGRTTSGSDLLNMAVLTLTAQNETVTNIFNPPIKMRRNTSITYTGSFTAGNCARCGVVWGYTQETTNDLN